MLKDNVLIKSVRAAVDLGQVNEICTEVMESPDTSDEMIDTIRVLKNSGVNLRTVSCQKDPDPS